MGEKRQVTIRIAENGKHSLPDDNIIRQIAVDITGDMPAMRPDSFIYRVPDRLRVVDKRRYEPRIVSIGPFHREKEYLRISEREKKWYLGDHILRSNPEKTDSEDLVVAICMIETQARNCYAEELNMDTHKFVKMMVLDGCFLLELFYRYKEYKEKSKELDARRSRDPIFSAAWMVRTLQRDAVLLENQLPFIVLQSLFELTKDPTHDWTLDQLVYTFMEYQLPTDHLPCVPSHKTLTGNHLLDLVRHRLLYSFKPEEYGNFPKWNFTQYHATGLGEAGVTFKRKENGTHLFDITFSDAGVLEMPPLFFGEGVTILLPNLIALEQCHVRYDDYISSYIIFLNSLINAEGDVKILRESRIIEVNWIDDEKITAAIKAICKGVRLDDFYYDRLCGKVKQYCEKRTNKWLAILWSTYFSTPWSILSIVVGSILLLLTVLQTIISILQL